MGERPGEKLTVAAFSLRGAMGPDQAWDLAYALVETLGMTEAPGATLCRYPTDGKGGKGFTLFQPITESFIALDVWEEFTGAYLVVCSCKPFDPREIEGLLARRGYPATGTLQGTLGLR